MDIVLYENEDGTTQMDVRVEQETVWLTQDQMAELFGRERSVITKHLRNVFREGELDEAAVRAKFAQTAADGKTYLVQFLNLDAIISVGYRVNSRRGTQFRQWATMNRHVNAIACRLSLRPPQRRSLEILDRITEIAPPGKGADTAAALEVIRREFPSVEDFERDFPSLCFALALRFDPP